MEKVIVTMSPNEQKTARSDALRLAVAADAQRFVWGGFKGDLPLDIEFFMHHELKTKHDSLNLTTGKVDTEYTTYAADQIFNVELKEGADFPHSVFNHHLDSQILSARESGHPAAVVVLASDKDVKAICESISDNSPCGTSAESYMNRCIHFKGESFGKNNIPVFMMDYDWPKQLLSLAAAMFSTSDWRCHLPKSRRGERQAIALTFLVDRLSTRAAFNIMAEFKSLEKLALAISNPEAQPGFVEKMLSQIDGVGPVMARRLIEAMTAEVKQ